MPVLMVRALSVLVLVFSLLPLFAGEMMEGVCRHVADGDTITMKTEDGKEHRIRLYGVDAPEKGQDLGDASRDHLKSLVLKKPVRVEIMDVDQYDRKVCRLYCEGKYINREMVQAGLAWFYEYYAKGETSLEEAERAAKAARAGVWSGDNPVNPREYRVSQREGSAPGYMPQNKKQESTDMIIVAVSAVLVIVIVVLRMKRRNQKKQQYRQPQGGPRRYDNRGGRRNNRR